MRPFYPGGDYKKFNYPENSVVIDNPPFSILTQILDFYIENDISFFLFANARTIIGTFAKNRIGKFTAITTETDITYHNGAKVKTAFVTNLDDCVIRNAPQLSNEINKTQKPQKKRPSYQYPDNVIRFHSLAQIKSQEVKIYKAKFISQLDEMKKHKKNNLRGGTIGIRRKSKRIKNNKKSRKRSEL